MAKLTASEFAEKWGRRLSGATEDIRRGVEGVTESPGKRAASKKGKWVARLTDPAVQEKWARNIGSVTLEEWKARTVNVGIGRVAAGVEASKDRMVRFAEQLLSYQEANLGKIHAMPDVTLADSKARMDAWFEVMSKFSYKR